MNRKKTQSHTAEAPIKSSEEAGLVELLEAATSTIHSMRSSMLDAEEKRMATLKAQEAKDDLELMRAYRALVAVVLGGPSGKT